MSHLDFDGSDLTDVASSLFNERIVRDTAGDVSVGPVDLDGDVSELGEELLSFFDEEVDRP